MTVAWLLIVCAFGTTHAADSGADTARKLKGFDAYMQNVLRDWNGVGIGVGVVVGDELVFARGYGYRDYGQKLPITPATLFPIASNTKLFTAVAAGLLVEEGKLTWDQPVRQAVPSIQFHSDALNNTVTLRDMLAHRTGVTRHDSIWYKSDFTNQQLYDRLRFLEPSAPPRQIFLYNNMMYAGVGRITELNAGKPWKEYVHERILEPLAMRDTVFSIGDMVKRPDHGVPYTERRDSFELYRIPYYEDTDGLAAAGAMVSNIQDMSHWLIALMNDGMYERKQVLPAKVLKATLEPAIAQPNTGGEARGWWELLNAAYGMGRSTASYRGHLIAFHGGDLPGFHSQVSYLPLERIGVIVFVIGDHTAALYNPISYNVYERLMAMKQTPWSERLLDVRRKGKQAGVAARAKAGAGRIAGTKPAHALADYAGEYEHPAYGALTITLKDDQLQFAFHKLKFPLTHFHYERFDTPDDEREGKRSVNFSTNPQGDVDKATMSLDEAEATFVRRPPKLNPELLTRLAGTYESPTGAKFQIAVRSEDRLVVQVPGRPDVKLIPYKGLRFRSAEFADVVHEFVEEGGRITALKQSDPSGEYVSRREQ